MIPTEELGFPEPDEPDDSLVGSTIAARYHIQGVLGQGGMGVVYEGVQEGLERPVAVKVLKPEYAGDREAVERMFKEARAASRMGHPNICDVYDLGRLPDGRPYMVMPKLEGSDLGSLLEGERSLVPLRVAELLEGPAAALDVMHARGIVHRDIKPENMIRIVHADGSEVVQLVDFGLATVLFTDKRLTREGIICGTPHYMAPETGTGALPDARGDVYSLAVVAFELLTGELPFDSPYPMTILTMKMTKPPPRLGDVCDVRFPDAIEAVLRRGLAEEPDDRYPSATGFVHALAEAAKSSAAAAITTKESAPSIDLYTRRPNRVLLASVGALVFVAMAATTVVLWSGSDEPTVAEAPAAEIDEPPHTERELVEPDEPEVEPEPAAPRPDEPATDVPGETTMATAEPGARRRRLAVRSTSSPPSRDDRPTVAAEGTDDTDVVQGQTPLPDGLERDRGAAVAATRAGTDALLRGQLAVAVRELTTATRADPRHGPAWRGLGLARQRMGHASEAARAYRRYLALAPNAADASAIRERLAHLQTGP